MEVFGRKEARQDDGTKVVHDITNWTLLGLCVDHFYKMWARHGAPAVLQCDVYQHTRVTICHVVSKGSQMWPSPGVTRSFAVADAVVSLALKLLQKSIGCVRLKGWRVFDGDVDMTTACGNHKGAVDGLADKNDAMDCLALVEVKVRHLSSQMEDVGSLCNFLDQRWTKYKIPRLKVPWTHGILVVHYQASCSRVSVGRDSCHVHLWKRGAPPAIRVQVPTAPVAKAKPQAKPAAKAIAAPAVLEQSFDQKFRTVMKISKDRGAVVHGDWVLLKEFLRILDLPLGQTTRDYLTGSTSWRLGNGSGRPLQLNRDWDFKHGKRGGGRGKGHPHVKAGVLKDIMAKYYRNRKLKV